MLKEFRIEVYKGAYKRKDYYSFKEGFYKSLREAKLIGQCWFGIDNIKVNRI